MASTLRVEARATQLESLDETQWEAFCRLCDLLSDALHRTRERPPGARPEGPVDWMSAYRSSRIAFLGGERGTGKTTVLATLVVPRSPVHHRRRRPTASAASCASNASSRSKPSSGSSRVGWCG